MCHPCLNETVPTLYARIPTQCHLACGQGVVEKGRELSLCGSLWSKGVQTAVEGTNHGGCSLCSR